MVFYLKGLETQSHPLAHKFWFSMRCSDTVCFLRKGERNRLNRTDKQNRQKDRQTERERERG